MAIYRPMTALDETSLWIGFVAMALGAIAFGYLRWRKARPGSRGFYDKSIMIVSIAAVAYLAMALGIGQVNIFPGAQRVFIPRYVDWFFTTPLLLLDLILFAKPLLGENWQWDTALIIIFDDIMIATGLLSALDVGAYRWIWFGVSVVAYLVVAGRVLAIVRNARSMPGAGVASRLRLLALYLSAFWVVYPIVFALFFARVVSPGVEDLLYMLLDVGAKVGFGFVLLLGPAVDLVNTLPHVSRGPARQTDASQAGPAYAQP